MFFFPAHTKYWKKWKTLTSEVGILWTLHCQHTINNVPASNSTQIEAFCVKHACCQHGLSPGSPVSSQTLMIWLNLSLGENMRVNGVCVSCNDLQTCPGCIICQVHVTGKIMDGCLSLPVCRPYLYADLNWLPLSTLGVCDPFCVILARVDHRLWVFGLLLQGEGHPTHTHGPADR